MTSRVRAAELKAAAELEENNEAELDSFGLSGFVL